MDRVIRIRAYAKINWSLNILGVRPDGYHELDMLMQSIGLYDELEFRLSSALTVTMDGEPADERNLVTRAALALRSETGTENGAQIRLTKHIPARAGLGGGSADCAAALLALNDLWGLHLPIETLYRLALGLGADVPFCLFGGMKLVRGIGEKLTPVPEAPLFHAALVTPGGGLSTGPVFRGWDEGGYGIPEIDMKALADALKRRDLKAAQALSFNALEAPAARLMPEIGDIMERFRSLGAPFTRMTGSGSTVFAAFDAESEAKKAAEKVPGAVYAPILGKK